MPYSLAELNQMSRDEFVEAIGPICENTPEIAAQTWENRPFRDLEDLHEKLMAVIYAMSSDKQFDFICQHPDLGSKVAMTDTSVKEQTGAGLNQLTADEYERFFTLNQSYKRKFQFPFIVAVKNHTKDSILAIFEQRLLNDSQTELQLALSEIAAITKFRLAEITHT